MSATATGDGTLAFTYYRQRAAAAEQSCCDIDFWGEKSMYEEEEV